MSVGCRRPKIISIITIRNAKKMKLGVTNVIEIMRPTVASDTGADQRGLVA
jgi:hypothetical protein